jgi:cholesterol oxidase
MLGNSSSALLLRLVNLGINPSLSITVLAERAMSFWPNKDNKDARLPIGDVYQRVAPVYPRASAVLSTAPGALQISVEPGEGPPPT